MGLTQGLVFQYRLPSLRSLITSSQPIPPFLRWLVFTGGGASVGWYVTILLSILLSLVLGGGNEAIWLAFAIGGCVLGGFQWWLLRKRLQSSIWLIPLTGLAAGVGSWFGWEVSLVLFNALWPDYESAFWSYPESITLVIAGITGMAMFSVISSLALIESLRRDGNS